MSPTQRTFVTRAEDTPGVLNRIISLFRRRGFNIESLTVGRTAQPGIALITVVVHADEDTARRLKANLYKLVNVQSVDELSHNNAVVRELALIKVKADADSRPKLLQLCEMFRARPVDISPASTTIELTGTLDKVDALIALLQPHEILEVLRTGAVAMARGTVQDKGLAPVVAARTLTFFEE